MKRSLVIVAALAGVVLLSAESCEPERTRDAPRLQVDETSPAQVIQMPDGFSNVATKCVDGFRYTTLYHASNSADYSNYGSVSVVADPSCAKAAG